MGQRTSPVERFVVVVLKCKQTVLALLQECLCCLFFVIYNCVSGVIAVIGESYISIRGLYGYEICILLYDSSRGTPVKCGC